MGTTLPVRPEEPLKPATWVNTGVAAAVPQHNADVGGAGTTQVQLLGPVRLLVDGAPVRLGGAKQQAVLAVLALRSPRVVTTDQLIDAVWGDDPPATARNAVQVYVSGLRGLLPVTTAIERAADGYRLVGPSLQVDAADLERDVAEGRAVLRSDDAARAVELLGRAIDLWVGDPLGGLDGLPFHDEARRSLEDTRLAAVLDRAEGLLRTGETEQAADGAGEVTRERPFQERAWGLLATALYHSGRQAEALDACRRVRDLLADELGIDPSPELVRLEQAILRQELAPPWSPAEEAAPETTAPAPTVPPLPSPFVGRDELVRELLGHLDGHGIVTLLGLGGIGKTTVALAAAHAAAAAGRRVHFCELETETAARPALERVAREVGADPGDDPAAALGALPDDVLLVLDNVEQVAGLGGALAGALRSGGPSVLATSRVPLRLRDEVVVHVGPLSVQSPGDGPSPAAEMFAAVASRVRPGLDPATALAPGERVAALLDGIPLAIELAAMRARVLTVDQVADRLEGGSASGLDGSRRADVPERQSSLGAIIASAVGALADAPADLLRRLASMDGWTSIELVEEVVDDLGADVVDGVEDLVDAGLVDLGPDGRVRVRTPVRELVLRTDGPGERAAVDARVAAGVAALVGRVAPTLFGGSAADGLARLERDHDPLTGVLARATAAGSPVAVDLVLSLNRYWLLTGRVVEGRRMIDAARAIEGVPVRDRLRLDILGGTFAAYANDATANDLLVPALEAAAAEGLPVDRLVVNGWCNAAAVEAQRRHADPARHHASEASRVAALSGDPALVALARDLVGFVAAHLGDSQTALEAHLEGLKEARRSGDTHEVVNVLVSLVDDLVPLGRIEDALAISEEAFELVVTCRTGPLLGHVLSMRGMSLLCAERVPEAVGVLTESLRIARDEFPDPIVMGDRLALLAVASAMQRQDVVAARWWGAAEGLLADQELTPRMRLSARLLDHADQLARRLDGRFEMLATAGSASPRHVIDALLGG